MSRPTFRRLKEAQHPPGFASSRCRRVARGWHDGRRGPGIVLLLLGSLLANLGELLQWRG